MTAPYDSAKDPRVNDYNTPSEPNHRDMSGMRNAPEDPKKPQPDKPTQLYNAIWRVERLNRRLNHLIAKVASQPVNAEDCQPDERGEVSLLEVLNEGPDLLDSYGEHAHNQINELETLLFTP